MYLLECYIEHPVRSIDQTFTYYSNEPALPGVRVLVDFNHRSIMGFVEHVTETEESLEAISARIGYPIKPVEEILDQEPLITEELADLAAWMKETTLSTMISCYQAMLPSKIKPKGNRREERMEPHMAPEERKHGDGNLPYQLDDRLHPELVVHKPYRTDADPQREHSPVYLILDRRQDRLLGEKHEHRSRKRK